MIYQIKSDFGKSPIEPHDSVIVMDENEAIVVHDAEYQRVKPLVDAANMMFSAENIMSESIGVECASIPVEVAAKIAGDIVGRALAGYKADFKSESGYIQWGKVLRAFREEMEAASNGKITIWDGRLEPISERKLRKIEAIFRDWPEPACEQCLQILANG